MSVFETVSSAEWKRLANKCMAEARQLEVKKSAWQSYQKKLKDIEFDVFDICSRVSISEGQFKRGGFKLASGGTMCQDKFDSFSSDGDTLKTNLDTLINDMQLKIDEYEKEYKSKMESYRYYLSESKKAKAEGR